MFSKLSTAIRAWKATADIPPEVSRSVLLLMCPVGIVGLVLKLHRITQHPSDPGFLEGALLLGGEVLAYLGFALLMVGGLVLTARVGASRVGLVVAQLVALLLIIVSLAAHNYFLSTGFTLGFGFVKFSLLRINETAAVVASEISLPLIATLAGVVLSILALPWIFGKKPSGPASQAVGGKTAGAALAHVFLGATLVSLSLVPTGQDLGREFFREPTVALVASGLRTHLGSASDGSLGPVVLGTHSGPRPVGPAQVTARPEAGALNLVLVLLESTRAQATTPYNPELPTTPFLDQLAKNGMLVERAYAVVP
ncbi:MAG TPA: hypothetical protein DIU15_00585, partial [Deltaproteobacteria bacterium]|nr:hypothetical protein [Deltaproteobacteria bacterium]